MIGAFCQMPGKVSRELADDARNAEYEVFNGAAAVLPSNPRLNSLR
jgi:hypothetical protein